MRQLVSCQPPSLLFVLSSNKLSSFFKKLVLKLKISLYVLEETKQNTFHYSLFMSMIESSFFKDYLLQRSLGKSSTSPQCFLIDVNILFSSTLGTEKLVCLHHLSENCQECQEAREFHSCLDHQAS